MVVGRTMGRMMPLRRSFLPALLLVILLTPGYARATWPPPQKKLIHAGYPSEVSHIRRHIDRMNALPFDGTILIIHELDSLFNYERKLSRDEVQSKFDDLAATPWGRLTHNFLKLNVELHADIDWFDDAQWEVVEHNLALAMEAVVVAGAEGIIFDPEQYSHRLWMYEKAAHHATKSFDAYFAQLRKRGAQWMRAVQRAKPDVTILHYYLLTAFAGYFGDRPTPGGDTRDLLPEHSYGLYLGFINGMLDVIGPEVTLVDGNESAYYYGGRAAYDNAYVKIRQERRYLIDPTNREKYDRQVQVGSALYIQGTMGMRNYSIQALGAFLDPAQRLQLMEHRAYQALRTTDAYVWCYSDSRNISWWNGHVPDGLGDALRSAQAKIAAGVPLGFSEAPFESAKKKQQDLMQHGRSSIVPFRAAVPHVGDDGPPVLDGRLDDAIWQRSPHLGPFRVPNIFIKPNIQAPTTAQVAWDDEHFYAAFTCMEPNVEAMSKRKTGVDTVVWHDDCVEVFISAGPDLFPYRQFEANAIDTRFDSSWFARKKMDGSWNATWNSRAAIGEDRWICEIAIPWRDIGSAPAPGDQRRGNLTRHRIPHEEETTTWTPMYKTFSDAEYLATWVFEAAGQR